MLCSWARHFILTVTLSTQVYKWVPANCSGNGIEHLLGSNLRWTLKGQYHERYSKFFCENYARIIKVPSLINKITLKRRKGMNSLPKMCTNHNQIVFSVFLQVILSNLKTSARRFQTLDHFFSTCPKPNQF